MSLTLTLTLFKLVTSFLLIIRGSESEKTNSIFNLISQQSDIDTIYLYAKDPYEAKYHF